MRKPTRSEWREISDLFDTLVDLPAARRGARLKAVALDPFVAGQLNALLDAEGGVGVLDRRIDFAGGVEPPIDYASVAPGTIIGGFRVDRLIGRGGMGEVYLAHRDGADFDQRVALKMLRPEAVGRTRLFDAERRLLAGLEHPGIARLIDGGVAPDGRPYMALEYVEGREIGLWCREERAGLADRLRLFHELCDAVSHAHARLVIHRDIKPSNILVDNSGRARLLDFGVAQLIDAAALDRATTQALLTPDYAAPEQFDRGETTVATDVYALGAMLFTLLAGRGPWRTDNAPLPTVLRRLLHDDPPLPSRVATPDGVATARIAGDLDAIVLKAMRRSPDERYPSVAALAEDVRRYQLFEPVRARVGSAGYRVRRFLRRNRWTAAATAAGLVALLTGAGGIAIQARVTRIERDIARAEAEQAEAVNQMMTVMFQEASDAGRPGSIPARDLIDMTSRRVLASLDPAAPQSVRIIGALSGLYVMGDDIPGAQALLEAALSQGVGRADPVGTARLKFRLAQMLSAMRRFGEARALLAEASAVWQREPDRFQRERVEAAGTEAYMLRLEGKRDEGIALLLATMPEAERAYADNSRDLAMRYAHLATHLMEANRVDEAADLVRRSETVIARSEQMRSPVGLTFATLRGSIALRRGEAEAAEAIFRDIVTARRRLEGPSSALAADLLRHGRALLRLDRIAAALAVLDEAAPMAGRYSANTTAPSMIGLARAQALARMGRADAATAATEEIAAGIRGGPAISLDSGVLLQTRAVLALERGDFAASAEALDAADAVFGEIGAPAAGFAAESTLLKQRMAKARP